MKKTVCAVIDRELLRVEEVKYSSNICLKSSFEEKLKVHAGVVSVCNWVFPTFQYQITAILWFSLTLLEANSLIRTVLIDCKTNNKIGYCSFDFTKKSQRWIKCNWLKLKPRNFCHMKFVRNTISYFDIKF